MYDRILVPTDGSAGVERAVDHAVDLAATHGAELYALYVINSANYGGLPMETSWDGIRDVLVDEGETALERVEEIAAKAGVEVRTAIADGSPSRQIVQHAAANDCDLIVMGTHGRGGIDRLLLGSVAERVVRSSELPVLTVRVGEVPEDAGEGAGEENGGEAATAEE